MIILSPSLLAADMLFLSEELDSVADAGLTHAHVDIMDGHFVPNISYGVNLAHAVKRHGRLKFDCHLMVNEPEKYVVDFAAAGPELITVHYESTNHLHRLVYRIKELGIQAGVALNPATPASILKSIISDIDVALVMTVNPGFGGQKFIPSMVRKIAELREMALEQGKALTIQVDGGISQDTAPLCVNEGATYLVAGASFFNSSDRRRFADSIVFQGIENR